MMESLPWYVVYGNWFWAAGLLVAAVAALCLIRLRVRLRVRRQARNELRRMGKPSSLEEADEGQLVVLSGTLGLNGAPARRFEDGEAAVATTAAPTKPGAVLGALAITRCAEAPHLEVGGVQVGIEGAVEVRVGSRELHAEHRFKRAGLKIRRELEALDEETLKAVERYPMAFRSLSEGDRVRLQGFLRRLAAPIATDSYRAPAGRWVLSSSPDPDTPQSREHVVSAVFEGAPTAEGPSTWIHFKSVLVAVVLVFILEAIAGVTFLMMGDRGSHPYEQCSDQPIPTALKVATAFPVSRRVALEDWEVRLERLCFVDRPAARKIVTLQLLRGRCDLAAHDLARRYEIDRAVEVARRCADQGDANILYFTLYRTGRFRELSDLLTSTSLATHSPISFEMEVAAHVLADRPEQARAALAELPAPFSRSIPPRKLGWNRLCVRAALAAREGDESALAELRELAAGETSRGSVCPLLLADLLRGRERLEYLRSLEDVPHAYQRFADVLALEAQLEVGAEEVSWDFDAAILSLSPDKLIRPRETSFARFTSLDRDLLERLEAFDFPDGGFRRTRATLATRAAVFAFMVGANDEARDHAEAALRDVSVLGGQEHLVYQNGTWASLARGRLAVIALDSGDIGRARELALELERMPSATTAFDPVAALYNYVTLGKTRGLARAVGWGDQELSVWEAAYDGSERELIDRVRHEHSPRLRDHHPLWANLVSSGQDEVLEQILMTSRHDWGELSLSDALFSMSFDWQVATALGDRDWADRIDEPRSRVRAAVLRRDTLFVLLAMGAL